MDQPLTGLRGDHLTKDYEEGLDQALPGPKAIIQCSG